MLPLGILLECRGIVTRCVARSREIARRVGNRWQPLYSTPNFLELFIQSYPGYELSAEELLTLKLASQSFGPHLDAPSVG